MKKIKHAHSVQVGVSFGLTSGVITTLGLMVGIYASTQSTLAVVSSILTIAIADAMSDALGIHISEESENVHTPMEVWVATLTTFFSKFFVSITFLFPVLLVDLKTAVLVNIGWGVLLMTAYNIYIGRKQQANTWGIVAEHLLIAAVVIVVTYFLGDWIAHWIIE